MGMKKLLLFLVFLLSADLYGAAHRYNPRVIEGAPYLQLILEPAKYLNNDRYFQGEQEDKQDLINFASRIKIAELPTLKFLYQTMATISQMPAQTVPRVLQLLDGNPFMADAHFRKTVQLARKYLRSGTMQDAIRWLSSDALKRRLHRLQDGTILDVFFTPLHMPTEHTTLEETLVWLIRSEQQSIRVASYFFTNKAIAYNLRLAMERGVRVEVIVDKGNYASRRSTVLDEFGIPYKIWQHPNPHERNIKMHQKFMLFGRNIDDQSIVAMGSYNITEMANRQHENMLITNDRYIFDRFARRFDFIDHRNFVYSPVYYDRSDDDAYDDDSGDEFAAEVTRVIARNKAAQLLLDALQVRADMLLFAQAEEEEESRGRSRLLGASSSTSNSSSSGPSSSSARR